MSAPQLILHVGGPKCGSTALQSALSLTPDLTDTDGRRLRYTARRGADRIGLTLYGADVVGAAQSSAYGYASWPNFKPGDADAPVFDALDRARRRGLRANHIPVASCEGWISRPHAFAKTLARWGHPPVEVVAFLRPTVDWTNSAFWQWGIWHVPSLDAWMRRSNFPYRFGLDLEAWSKIPNVRLRVAPAQPDAVARFATWQGVALPPAPTRNASSSPALIGVLLRNRALRAHGHDAAAEFVVQRWCPPVAGRRPWAVLVRHVHALRPVARANFEALTRLDPDIVAEELLDASRWLDEHRYHDQIREGVSRLNDPEQLAELHAALIAGLVRVHASLGDAPGDIPAPCPSASAHPNEWDAVLVPLLTALLAADARVRSRTRMGMRHRLANRLVGLQAQIFSRSR